MSARSASIPLFADTLKAWGTAQFERTLKREIAAMDRSLLPLQQGLASGDHVTDDPLTVLIIDTTANEQVLHVKAAILYQSIVAGCSCADDPTPLSNANERCDIQLGINRRTAIATVTLLD